MLPQGSTPVTAYCVPVSRREVHPEPQAGGEDPGAGEPSPDGAHAAQSVRQVRPAATSSARGAQHQPTG